MSGTRWLATASAVSVILYGVAGVDAAAASELPSRLDLQFTAKGSGPDDVLVTWGGVSYVGGPGTSGSKAIVPVDRTMPVEMTGGGPISRPVLRDASPAEFRELMVGDWRIELEEPGGSTVIGEFRVSDFSLDIVPTPGQVRILEPEQGATVGPDPFVVRWDGGSLDDDERLDEREFVGDAFGSGLRRDLITRDTDLSDGQALFEIVPPHFDDGGSSPLPVEIPASILLQYELDVSDDLQVTEPTAVFDQVRVIMAISDDWDGYVVVPEPATGLVWIAGLTLLRRRGRLGRLF